MPTIEELLREQVTLEVECLDRLYLNGYVPTLQMSGQLVTFLTQHRGHPIPSPTLPLRGRSGIMQLPTVHQGWGGQARRGRAAPARARAGTGRAAAARRPAAPPAAPPSPGGTG